MSWITILSGLIKLASSIASLLERRQLIEAGEAKAMAKNLQEVHKDVKKAHEIRNRIKFDPSFRDRVRSTYKINNSE